MIILNINKYLLPIIATIVFICTTLLLKQVKIPFLVVRLGDISYSFYLIHYYVIIIVSKLVPMDSFDHKFILGILLILAISIPCSYISYQIILASRAESEGTMQNSEIKEKAKWKRSSLSGYIYCSACLFIPQLGEQKKICPNCKKEMESEDDNAK